MRGLALIRKMSLGFVIFLVICVALYLRFRHPKAALGTAYAGDRALTLYDSSAQVRSPIGSVDYGEPLEIEERFGDQVEVRTPQGLLGWTSNDELISAELWQQEKDLNAKTADTTPESRGHTRVLSNLHMEPGRDTPRVRQIKKNIPVELFERAAVPVPGNASASAVAEQPESDAPDQTNSSAASNEPRKEDWWLVRAQVDDKSAVSGWLLGRFVDLDVPETLLDYASTANMRVVAWFTLNPATDQNAKEVPQYLLVGTSGEEGQACDFTMMRVYTWAKMNAQYETAFVQNDVCGKLPIKITRMPAAQQATITFSDPGENSPQEYLMHQTIVRKVNEKDDTSGAGHHARAKKAKL
jgi:hypothetical protein